MGLLEKIIQVNRYQFDFIANYRSMPTPSPANSPIASSRTLSKQCETRSSYHELDHRKKLRFDRRMVKPTANNYFTLIDYFPNYQLQNKGRSGYHLLPLVKNVPHLPSPTQEDS